MYPSIWNTYYCISAYYPEVPMLEVPQPRPGSSLSNWVKKHSPLMPTKSNEQEVILKPDNEYDMDCPDNIENEEDKVGSFFLNLHQTYLLFANSLKLSNNLHASFFLNRKHKTKCKTGQQQQMLKNRKWGSVSCIIQISSLFLR